MIRYEHKNDFRRIEESHGTLKVLKAEDMEKIYQMARGK